MVDSLLNRIEINSKSHGDKDALTFLGSGPDGGVVESRLTYSDIASETDLLAINLLSNGLKRGDL